MLSWHFLASIIAGWLASTVGGSLNSAYVNLWEIIFSKDGHNNLSHPAYSSYNMTLRFTILIVKV